MAFIRILLLPSAAFWLWLRSVASMTGMQRVAAAIGFGLAVPATTFFVWRLAGGDTVTYPAVDTLAWIAIAIAGASRTRFARTTTGVTTLSDRLFIGALAVVLAALCAMLLFRWIQANPQGRWDAWAIWNLRAKFLAAKSGMWRNGFDPVLAWSHPDYPLLVPSAVARAWVITGGTSVAIPISISLAFTFVTLLTVVASLLASRGAAVAAMGFVLVAVPQFVLLGAAQMADVPLALYTVLAVSLLATPVPSAATLALSGAACGFAAWTKNEGLVVASVLPTCYVLVTWWRNGSIVARRTAINLAVGLAPMLVVVALYKILLAPPNDIVVNALAPGALHHWRDWARLRLVASAMARGAASWGGWPLGSPVVLVALLMLVPRGGTQLREPAVCAAGLWLVIQTTVFFLVYVTSARDVAWQVQASWFRLIAQVWPTLVWYACFTRGVPRAPGARGPGTATLSTSFNT